MVSLTLPFNTKATRHQLQSALARRLAPWQAAWLRLDAELDITLGGEAPLNPLWPEADTVCTCGSRTAHQAWLFAHLAGLETLPPMLPGWARQWADSALCALTGPLLGYDTPAIVLRTAQYAPVSGCWIGLTLHSPLGQMQWSLPETAVLKQLDLADPLSPPLPGSLLQAAAQCPASLDCMLPPAMLPLVVATALETGDVILLEKPLVSRLFLQHDGMTVAECELSPLPGHPLRVLGFIDSAKNTMTERTAVPELPLVTVSQLAADKPAPIAPGGQGLADPLKYVADVEVRLDFRLGQASLTLGALQALKPGSTIRLDLDRGLTVDIHLNGHLIGEGALVNVDDELAVQVTRIVAE